MEFGRSSSWREVLQRLLKAVSAMSLCMVLSVHAQPVDTVLTRFTPIASFKSAHSVATDGLGNLYVTDVEDDAVFRLDVTGKILDILGGPGSGVGQFDDPMDVDPTNGLMIIVADAGNGRLQRFSREFMPLGVIPVSGSEENDQRSDVSGRSVRVMATQDTGKGRPVSVVSPRSSEILYIDADRGLIVKWDESGRPVDTIGGYDEGPGSLANPVSLAVTSSGRLYVADAGRSAVLVYDQFGSYVRTLAEGLATGIRSVMTYNETLWLILPERLVVFDEQGRLSRTIDVHLDESLVDAVAWNSRLFLLTEAHLFQVDFDPID